MINFNLKNKKILLTGGSRGIGLSILDKLYSLGCEILIIGSSKENLENVKKKYSNIHILQYDLSDHTNMSKMFQEAVGTLGGIDVLINNAGITKDNLAIRMSKDEWTKVIDTNLTSCFLLCQEAIKIMIKKKSGSIVNISSVVAHLGNDGQVNYSSSKAALIAMSKSLAREYAKKNIRINSISPGFILTNMTESLKDEYKSELLKRIPMDRMGSGEDVANGIVFLASDMSSYITGETLHINGGMYMA